MGEFLLAGYATEQRKALFSFFTKHPDRHFTIEEIADNICGISVSTTYRNVNKLVEDGIVRRFQKDGQRKFLYQYIGNSECNSHLHLKCNTCGRIFHLDNDAGTTLTSAIKNNYDFEVDKTTTILFGACSSCN